MSHAEHVSVAAMPVLAAPDNVQASVHTKLRKWLESHTGDSELQNDLMKELGALLTDENVGEILQSLSPTELGTPFGTEALERWLTADLFKAAQWISARTDANEAQAWLVGRKLLDAPVASLDAFCDALPNSAWKQNLLSGAGLEVVSRDPREAIHLAQKMDAGPGQTNLLQTVAYDWTERDPDAALQWITRVDDSALREKLFAVSAKAIATADPDLAAKWLVSAVKSEDILKETALSIVEIWVAQDPAKAADWVSSFPSQGPRKAALDIVVRQWSQTDPDAARAWIQQLPERSTLLAKMQAHPSGLTTR